MSAFDLFSFKPIAEPKAPAPAAALPPESPRGEDGARSFRDELSKTDSSRSPEARAERQATRNDVRKDAETQAIDSADEAARPAPDNEVDEVRGLADADGESIEAAPVADAERPASATAPDNESGEGESPVAELVLDLIAAFENVLENNPLAQAAGDAATGNGETATAFPGLTALFEALSAVSAVTGANAGQAAVGTATAGSAVVTPLSNVANATGTTAPVLAATPENASAQTQADGESSGGQNNNGNTPNGNASANAALNTGESGSLAANANQAIPLPGAGAEAAVSNTAAQAVTPLTNANPVGTDVSARLSPAGLADPNATNDAMNSARLTRGLNNAVNQQGGTVTLRLTPPDMGTVRIQLNLQGTNVSAQFHAETDSAQRLLTQQLGQLRTSLESQGLNVEKLGVQAMTSSSNSSSLQQQSSGDSPQSQTNADGRSRGQFGQSSQQNNQGRDGGDDPNATPTNFTQLLDPAPGTDPGTDPALAEALTGTA